jgi:hypothetical protein
MGLSENAAHQQRGGYVVDEVGGQPSPPATTANCASGCESSLPSQTAKYPVRPKFSTPPITTNKPMTKGKTGQLTSRTKPLSTHPARAHANAKQNIRQSRRHTARCERTAQQSSQGTPALRQQLPPGNIRHSARRTSVQGDPRGRTVRAVSFRNSRRNRKQLVSSAAHCGRAIRKTKPPNGRPNAPVKRRLVITPCGLKTRGFLGFFHPASCYPRAIAFLATARMFTAAFVSLSRDVPHIGHRCHRSLSVFGAVYPQPEHLWDV